MKLVLKKRLFPSCTSTGHSLITKVAINPGEYDVEIIELNDEKYVKLIDEYANEYAVCPNYCRIMIDLDKTPKETLGIIKQAQIDNQRLSKNDDLITNVLVKRKSIKI
jgi:hypothetical protein